MTQLKRKIAVFILVVLIAPDLMNILPYLSSITKVTAANQEFSLETSSGSIGILSTPARIHIRNTINPEEFEFNSSNTSIVTVNSWGFIEGKKKGTAKIAVTHKETGRVIGTYNVTVKDSEINANDNRSDQWRKDFSVGETFGIQSLVQYHSRNAQYEFTVSNPKIVDLKNPYTRKSNGEEDGMIGTTLSKGTTKVTVKQKVNGKYKELGTTTITVLGMTVPKDVYIRVGDADMLYNESYSGSRVNYKFLENENLKAEYEFKSSNEDVFKLITTTEQGYGGKDYKRSRYEAPGSGNAVLEIIQKFNGKETKYNVNVHVLEHAVLNRKELTVVSGEQISFGSSYRSVDIIILGMGGERYIYQSSNEKIVSVEDGDVRAKQPGNAILTVSEVKTVNTDTKETKVSEVGKINIKVIPAAVMEEERLMELNLDEIGLFERRSIWEYLDYDYYDGTRNIKLTAVSSNPNVISIKDKILTDRKGKITYKEPSFLIKKVGNATITIKATYNGITTNAGKVKIKVVNKPAELSSKIFESGTSYDHINEVRLEYQIRYLDSRAKYTYELDKKSSGKITDSVYSIKGAGNANVTYYETLNGKKRKLGVLSIEYFIA